MGTPLQMVESGLGIGGEGAGGGIFAGVGSGLAIVTTAFKAVKFVRQGQMGIRTSYGRATYPEDYRKEHKRGQPYGIVGRGPHLVWPFTHSIIIVDVKDRTSGLPELFPDTDNGHQFRFASSLTWAVSPEDDNPLKSYFNVEKPEALAPTVVQKAADGLRYVLENMSSQNMKDKNLVQAGLFATTGGLLLGMYGVEMKGLNVITSTRSDIDRLTESIGKAGRMAPAMGSLAAAGMFEPRRTPEDRAGGFEGVTAEADLAGLLSQNVATYHPNLGYM